MSTPPAPAGPRRHPGRGTLLGMDENHAQPGPWLPWRRGRSVGRTLYDSRDLLIGVMDTPELARIVVDAVNSRRPA